MSEEVHVFDSGVRVYTRHISPVQAARYRTVNRHEPIEEEWFTRLSLDGRGSFRFVDVGAGIGYYAILLKRLKPAAEALCFEPLPLHAEYLAANLALNAVDPTTVRVFPHAVSDTIGRQAFHEEDFGSHLIAAAAPSARLVETTTLEAIVGEHGPIDLVKIDVQGDERRVIAGAGSQRTRIRTWIVGTHGPDLHRESVIDLARAGFDILYDDPAPAGQPDGLVVAARP
jgi:FkbM family methyltransferase